MKQLYQKLHTRLKELEDSAVKRPVKFFLLKLGFLLSHLAILLFKNAGEGFNIITNNSEKTASPYSYTHYKEYQKKARVFSAAAATTVIVLSVILSLVLNLLFGIILPSQAATYTFTQTSWSGGATANTTGHPAPANWTEYSAKDANLTTVNGGADLQLVSAPTVNEYTIGALTNLTPTVSTVTDNGNNTWTIALGATNLSRIFKNDKFTDSASRAYKILSVADAADKIIVWDSEGTGIAPSTGAGTVGRWYASISLWEAGREGNLVTRNASERGLPYYDGAADTTAVTIDGAWTTDSTHYIEIYVPLSERHRGVWDSNRYYMQLTNATAITINENNVRIDGLQISLLGSSAFVYGIYSESAINDTRISNNIIKDAGLSSPRRAVFFLDLTNQITNVKIFNNLFYDFSASGDQVIYFRGAASGASVYNNTIVNSYHCFVDASSAPGIVAKNNIAQGCTDGYYSIIASGSDYNISDLASDAPGANSKNSTTVPFVDSTNKDFHLEFRDGTGNPAMNAGADLSADANLAFTTDIDNDTRSVTWDIGADDVGATLVKVHSIGTASRNFTTLQGWENARDGVLTTRNVFKIATQSAAFTEGETITGTSGATGTYIKERDTPSASETYMTVDKVNATAFVAGDTLTGGTSLSTATLSTILTAAGTIERGEAYKDSTFNLTSDFTIAGSTVDSSHYMWITVPPSDRHSGVFDKGAKITIGGDYVDAFVINNNYTIVEGFLVDGTGYEHSYGVNLSVIGTIRNNIFYGLKQIVGNKAVIIGVSVGNGNIYNNIIYRNTNNSVTYGINVPDYISANIYNNIVYNYNIGYIAEGPSGTVSVKNNMAINNTTDYSSSGFDTSSNNISSDATAPGANSLTSQTLAQVAFVSTTAGMEDFHLLPASVAKDAGTSLSSTFTTDVDGDSRPIDSIWDIGADETSRQFPYPTTAQTLTSSAYNSTDTANVIGALSWTEDVSLPTGTTVTVSLRAATSSANLTSASWSDFTNATANCTKTTGTVTCSLAAIPASLKDGTGDQWFQYKVTLTSTGASTPTLAAVTVSYVVNSPPSLSSVTALQGSDGVVSVGYDFSDSDNSSATVGLFADIGLAMSDNPLSSTATSMTISSASLLPSTGTVLLDSEEITYTGKTSNTLTGLTRAANTTTAASHTQNSAVWIKGTTVSGNVGASTATGAGKTASWTIATDLPNIENASAKILVLANDLNLANQVGTGQSSTLTIDTKTPAVSSLVVDASQTPAALTFSVSDLSSLQYKVGLSSGAGAFTSYSTSTAITITATDPSTVYYTFKDAKGNQTTGSQATMETPATFMVQDVSNLKSNATSTYQLFSAWQVVSNPSAGFKQYNVYRSTDNVTYSLLTTVTNRLLNYYLDASAVQNTLYYYKVTSQDNSNNISFYSSALQGKANGTQDSGEGGGGQPTITSVITASKTTQTATITWTTNTLSDSTVEYEASNSTPASYSSSQGVPSMVTSHSVTLRGLTPNTKYYFKVKSTDPSSLQGSSDNSGAGYSFTTNTGPSISAVTTPNITNTTAQISWNTDTASDTFVIYSTNSSLSSPTTTGTTTLSSSGPPYSHTVNLSSLTGGTTYYFYVQSTDQESNTAQDKNVVSGVIQYYSFKTSQDATAPTLTLTCSTAASPITDTVATITWGTSEASTSQIEYGIVTGTYPSVTTIKQDLDTSHTQTLSGLLDTTTYYYRVRSKDASNNETVSGQCTFTTRERLIPASQTGGGGGGGGFIDRTAPTISAIKVQDIVKDQARITWTTNEKATSLVRYGESEKYEKSSFDFTSLPAQHIDHEVVAGPLNPATVYHYQVLSQDSFGNLAQSKDDTFKTISGKPASAEATAGKEEKKDEALDAITKEIIKKLGEGESLQDVLTQANKTLPIPVIIGEIPRVQVTPNEVTITWKTDLPATSLIALSPEQNYNPNVKDSYLFEVGNTQDLTTDHIVTIQNLLPGTVYHFQVRSKGIIGESAKSRDYTFTTLTEKSQISNPLVKSVSDTQALVTWYTTTLGDSLVIFTPYRNNIPKEDERKSQGTPQFTQNHQVLFSSLSPGTKYKVQIQSKDRFNNLAEETIESFTTGKDLAPPEISLVRIKSAIAAGKVPIVQSIITWKTDELSTGQIFYQEGAGLLDMAKSQKTQKDENLSTNHVVVLTNFAPGRVYRFKVASQDQQANEAVSRDYTTLTPQRQQTVIDIIIKNFQDTFGFLKNLK